MVKYLCVNCFTVLFLLVSTCLSTRIGTNIGVSTEIKAKLGTEIGIKTGTGLKKYKYSILLLGNVQNKAYSSFFHKNNNVFNTDEYVKTTKEICMDFNKKIGKTFKETILGKLDRSLFRLEVINDTTVLGSIVSNNHISLGLKSRLNESKLTMNQNYRELLYEYYLRLNCEWYGLVSYLKRKEAADFFRKRLSIQLNANSYNIDFRSSAFFLSNYFQTGPAFISNESKITKEQILNRRQILQPKITKGDTNTLSIYYLDIDMFMLTCSNYLVFKKDGVFKFFSSAKQLILMKNHYTLYLRCMIKKKVTSKPGFEFLTPRTINSFIRYLKTTLRLLKYLKDKLSEADWRVLRSSDAVFRPEGKDNFSIKYNKLLIKAIKEAKIHFFLSSGRMSNISLSLFPDKDFKFRSEKKLAEEKQLKEKIHNLDSNLEKFMPLKKKVKKKQPKKCISTIYFLYKLSFGKLKQKKKVTCVQRCHTFLKKCKEKVENLKELYKLRFRLKTYNKMIKKGSLVDKLSKKKIGKSNSLNKSQKIKAKTAKNRKKKQRKQKKGSKRNISNKSTNKSKKLNRVANEDEFGFKFKFNKTNLEKFSQYFHNTSIALKRSHVIHKIRKELRKTLFKNSTMNAARFNDNTKKHQSPRFYNKTLVKHLYNRSEIEDYKLDLDISNFTNTYNEGTIYINDDNKDLFIQAVVGFNQNKTILLGDDANSDASLLWAEGKANHYGFAKADFTKDKKLRNVVRLKYFVYDENIKIFKKMFVLKIVQTTKKTGLDCRGKLMRHNFRINLSKQLKFKKELLRKVFIRNNKDYIKEVKDNLEEEKHKKMIALNKKEKKKNITLKKLKKYKRKSKKKYLKLKKMIKGNDKNLTINMTNSTKLNIQRIYRSYSSRNRTNSSRLNITKIEESNPLFPKLNLSSSIFKVEGKKGSNKVKVE